MFNLFVVPFFRLRQFAFPLLVLLGCTNPAPREHPSPQPGESAGIPDSLQLLRQSDAVMRDVAAFRDERVFWRVAPSPLQPVRPADVVEYEGSRGRSVSLAGDPRSSCQWDEVARRADAIRAVGVVVPYPGSSHSPARNLSPIANEVVQGRAAFVVSYRSGLCQIF